MKSTLRNMLIQDRREIEHQAFSGQLLGIIATNALELGIDIGALDAVLMLGFPNSISNFVSPSLSYHTPFNNDHLAGLRRNNKLGELVVVLMTHWQS